MGKNQMPLNLYWCETDDHDEDWFIVAASEEEACRIHENAEGYDTGDTEAFYICPIPDSLHAQSGRPEQTLLEALGAEFIRTSTPRIVRLKGETYQEGVLDAVLERVSSKSTKEEEDGESDGTKRLH